MIKVKDWTAPDGTRGWKARVRQVYDSLEELRAYDETHGVVHRCYGYASAAELWEANPVLHGSTNPAHFGVHVESIDVKPAKPTTAERRRMVEDAAQHLLIARNLLYAARAPRTLERTRAALRSAQGAVRNAQYRQMRERYEGKQ